jgi:hypothetical protein
MTQLSMKRSASPFHNPPLSIEQALAWCPFSLGFVVPV